jgi:hypothetical protein
MNAPGRVLTRVWKRTPRGAGHTGDTSRERTLTVATGEIGTETALEVQAVIREISSLLETEETTDEQ